MGRTRIVSRLVLAALCCAYVIFRLWRLTDSCLWFDEIFSVHAAEHSWSGLFSFVERDLIHPPLFYILLKIWIAVGGESLLWLRLLPVVISSIALVPFLLLCKELRLRSSAIFLALLFLAVNGPLIKYAQEVRMYSLLMCLALFSIWMFIRFKRNGKGAVTLAIVNIFLIYTHYSGWFIVGTEVLAIIAFRRKFFRRSLVMFAILILSFVPWAFAVWQASQYGEGLAQNIGWMERPGISTLVTFCLNLCEPFYTPASSIDPPSIYKVAVPILLLLFVAVAIFAASRKTVRQRVTTGILLPFILLPSILLFAASWVFPYSLWGARHLIIVFPAAMILFAIAIDSLKTYWLRTAIISLIVLFTSYGFVLQAIKPAEKQVWCAWEELAQKIGRDGPQRLYIFEDLTAYHFWFATRNRNDLRIIKANGIPEMTEDKAYFLPRGFDGVEEINASEITGDHFWIAFRDMKWDERHPPLNVLLEGGYRLGAPEVIDTGGVKAFLVEVRK